MTAITTVEAREHFSELVNRTAYGKERVILTRRGKNVAAMIPLEDLELIERIEEELDIHDAKLAIKKAKKHGTISLAAFKKNQDL